MADEALGFIETRGFAALTRVTDAMHKAAAVTLLDCVQIGSAYVTVLAHGDVAAVKAAVAAGLAELGGRKGLVGSNVLPAPHREIMNRFTRGQYGGEGEYGGALGLIETKGLAGLITAHDAALKAAHVTTIGFFAVGSGFVSIVLQGDVAAVEAAVAAGVEAVAGVAAVHATEVLPAPHAELIPAMIAGATKASKKTNAIARRGAVGIIETRGYVGAFAAADAGLKAAAVAPVCWKKIGGGLVSVTLGGDVAAINAAVDAGAEAARRVTEVVAVLVIPRPHESVFSGMNSP